MCSAVVVFVSLRPDSTDPTLVLVLLAIALHAAAVGWGLVVQNRRQLVASLKDRAARAETEARLRAEQAQHAARDALAREIHDVLGHRLSLLSVHAGALQYNPDASAQDVARAAEVIRENAHQALQDLREVIGVLRAPVGELPQPTLADVGELVGRVPAGRDGRRPGGGGRWHRAGDRRAHRVPGGAGGADQRPQARPRRRGGGMRVRGARARARRRGHEHRPAGAARAGARTWEPGLGEPGQGLLGLAERAALTGGRLEHGPTTEGGWRLAAWLPWPP